MMLTDLGVAFDAAGVPWIPVGYSPLDPTGAADWTTRGRPASTGPFDPAGVLCHHTASPAGTTAEADLNYILCGNADAPGPIAQLYIGRNAQLYVVAAGRANHGGKGRRPGLDTACADMNAVLVGIEVGNAGTGEYWGDAQTDLYAATVAALIDHYGWGLDAVYLHYTTGPPNGGCNSKIDPAGPWSRQLGLVGSTPWDLAVWRAYVEEHRGADAGATPPTPPTARRLAMSDFVVIYDMEAQGCPDGTVLELVAGAKRWVSGDEWWEIRKGVLQAADGTVPAHDPWVPVAMVTNGWYALGLPDYDEATSAVVPTVVGPPPDDS